MTYRAIFLQALVCMVSAVPAAAQDRFMAPLPADSELTISRDVPYATVAGRSFKFDLYRPRVDRQAGALPVVIFLNGIGADWFRGHVQYSSWPRFVTTAGLAGISMDAGDGTAAEDFDRLVTYLSEHKSELGIDPQRVIVWACSANVGAGLPLVQDVRRASLVGAVFYYGSGTVSRFRMDQPVLMVRAGADNPGLNRNMDRIAAAALAANAPVSVINHPAGRHGFDLRDDNEVTRAVMAQTLDFMAGVARPDTIAERARATSRATASAALFGENWAAAATAFERLAVEYPKDPEPQQRLGEALLAQKDFKHAAAALEKSLELGTNNRGIVSFALVRAYTALGEIDRAFAVLEKMPPFLKYFIQQLRDDPALAPLRADPRFSRIAG